MAESSTYRARRAAPYVVDRNTVRFLLLPQPLLSTLDLLLVRNHHTAIALACPAVHALSIRRCVP